MLYNKSGTIAIGSLLNSLLLIVESKFCGKISFVAKTKDKLSPYFFLTLWLGLFRHVLATTTYDFDFAQNISLLCLSVLCTWRSATMLALVLVVLSSRAHSLQNLSSTLNDHPTNAGLKAQTPTGGSSGTPQMLWHDSYTQKNTYASICSGNLEWLTKFHKVKEHWGRFDASLQLIDAHIWCFFRNCNHLDGTAKWPVGKKILEDKV